MQNISEIFLVTMTRSELHSHWNYEKVLKEAVTCFNITITVDDNLLNLHLKLFAVEFNDKALLGKKILSFKSSDNNFVSKKLKRIDVWSEHLLDHLFVTNEASVRIYIQLIFLAMIAAFTSLLYKVAAFISMPLKVFVWNYAYSVILAGLVTQ